MSKPEFVVSAYEAEADYDWLVRCWAGHGVGCLPRDVLPPTGVMVEIDGQRAACGVFWLTNAAAVVLGPIVTDPALDLRVQAAAVSAAVDAMVIAARAAVPDGLLWANAHSAAVRNLFVNRAGFHDTGSIYTAAHNGPSGFSLDILAE